MMLKASLRLLLFGLLCLICSRFENILSPIPLFEGKSCRIYTTFQRIFLAVAFIPTLTCFSWGNGCLPAVSSAAFSIFNFFGRGGKFTQTALLFSLFAFVLFHCFAIGSALVFASADLLRGVAPDPTTFEKVDKTFISCLWDHTLPRLLHLKNILSPIPLFEGKSCRIYTTFRKNSFWRWFLS